MEKKFKWSSIVKYNILTLKLFGVWPKGDKHKFNLYLLQAFIMITTFVIIQPASQTYKLLSNITDMEVVAGTSFMVISTSLIPYKIYYFLRHLTTIRVLLDKLDTDEIFRLRYKDQMEAVQYNISMWRLAYNGINISITVSLAFWTFDSFRTHRLPFLSWFPFDAMRSPVYEICVAHQISSLLFAAYLNIAMDTLIAACSVFAGAQFDILCDNLRNLQAENFKKNLVECVNHHREIVKFVNTYNDIFNLIILAQFLTSAVSLGITMFLVVLVPPLSSDFWSFLFYGNSVTMEIFIYCYFGNELHYKSSRVFFVAYESHWIEASEDGKHGLLFFMMNTQKPVKVSALNLFDLTLENFLRIMKTAYSYFALVNNMSD